VGGRGRFLSGEKHFNNFAGQGLYLLVSKKCRALRTVGPSAIILSDETNK
jgi:hypothetical protein